MVVLAETAGIYKQAAEQYKVLYKEEEKKASKAKGKTEVKKEVSHVVQI